jgi:hypothetical protein
MGRSHSKSAFPSSRPTKTSFVKRDSEKKYKVRPDWEYNAEDFWNALYEAEDSGKLTKNLKELASTEGAAGVTVTRSELKFLKSLPGWGEGPQHARDPLIIEEVKEKA